MNRILLAPETVDADGMARITGVQAAHIRTTLKLTPGGEFRLGILDGPRGTGTITAFEGDDILVRCDLDAAPPPRSGISLLLALPRPKVTRRLWAVLASLGVDRIFLTNASRVERNYFDTHWLAPEVYTPLLVEGLQQSGDTRLPRVSIHRRFKPFVEDELDAACPDTLRLVGHPSPAITLPRPATSAARIVIAVGPEGGWDASELALLESHGFHHTGLGWRILRSDTACVALITIAHLLQTPPEPET